MPVKINGSTSGSVTLAAPATGTDVTLTLPASTGTIPAVGTNNTWTGTQNFTGATLTGAGLDLIVAQSSADGASAISINNCFASPYTAWRIVGRIGSYSTGNAQRLIFRGRVSGTDVTNAAAYYSSGMYIEFAGTYNGYGNNGVNNYQQIANEPIYQGGAFVMDVVTTGANNFQSMSMGRTDFATKTSVMGGTTVGTLDGFTITTTSGTMPAMYIRVYGYRNS